MGSTDLTVDKGSFNTGLCVAGWPVEHLSGVKGCMYSGLVEHWSPGRWSLKAGLPVGRAGWAWVPVGRGSLKAGLPVGMWLVGVLGNGSLHVA